MSKIIIPYESLEKTNADFVAKYNDAFQDVLKSGWYILGQQVNAFEQEFASYCGTQYYIGVASGFHQATLSLPIAFFYTRDEISYVADCINAFE